MTIGKCEFCEAQNRPLVAVLEADPDQWVCLTCHLDPRIPTQRPEVSMNDFQDSMALKLRHLSVTAKTAAKYCGANWRDGYEFEGCVLYEQLLTLRAEVEALITDYVEDVPACDREAIRQMAANDKEKP